jgi:ribonuclease J
MNYDPGDLLWLPLGGAGEIGMNLSLYGHGGKWLMVDCGITFSDDRMPSIDVLVPDIQFIAEQKENLVGLVLTHAHEDHLGAVAHLWERLQCPIYATPFACGLLRRKLAEAGLERRVPITEVPPGGGFSVKPFSVEFIQLAHSVPQTQALVIETPAGRVLHASDWKLDPEPLLGPPTDEEGLRAAGKKGLVAMMCDSTNVFVDGHTGSEGPLRKSLADIVTAQTGRVVITLFASNVARMESAIKAGVAAGRSVCLVGRSLFRIAEISCECGYLEDCPEFVDSRDVGHLPRENILILATGSQGEDRAALARIAQEDHRDISLKSGDTVIFSSREIPGNERSIGRVQNALAKQGVKIITEHEEFVHVSGHPSRDDLRRLYDWVKPPLLVPIHGESRHLLEHRRFAEESGIPATAVAENGEVLRLAPGAPEIIDHVPAGRFGVDGKRLIPVGGEVLRARKRIGLGGVAVATLVMNGKGQLIDEPQLSAPGVFDEEGADSRQFDLAIDAMEEAVLALSPRARKDDDAVEEAALRALRRALNEATGKRPLVQIHVVRI